MGSRTRRKDVVKAEGDTVSTGAFHKTLWILVLLVVAVGISLTHTVHIWSLFENDRHFSHLADFEREMAYRTEMGLYYSFYKTLISAPTFADGLYELTNDNITEFGHTINTLKRFNVYPEVLVGAAYRVFMKLANYSEWKVEQCWRVNRGYDLPPVLSCEGIGNQHYFYVTIVFFLAGTVAASLFFLGVILSDTILGGILAVFCFFFNHGEATRVQWTPPLRESFGYPVFIAQTLLVTYILKKERSGVFWSSILSFFTTTFMLFWQFAAFVLATQIGSLFATYILDFFSAKTWITLLSGYVAAFGLSYVLLYGNQMLLTSLYLSSLLILLLIYILGSRMSRIKNRIVYLMLNGILYIAGTVGIKLTIGRALQLRDDAHILDILLSKFSNYANFHTRLYICAREFDFLGIDTLVILCKTLLLPCACFSFILVALYIVRNFPVMHRKKENGAKFVEVVYTCIQCVCFTIMAVLIMRLKLFMTPHLCIVTAILANSELICNALRVRITRWLHKAAVVGLIAMMAYQGMENINNQRSIQGEYSNPDQEFLFKFIMHHTKKDAVFAGTMPVMANVKLSTGRAIVNHPHYENAELRARTQKIYAIFSRKPLEEVYNTLKAMKVNYLVFQSINCEPNRERPECTQSNSWDLVDPVNRKRESLCERIPRALAEQRYENLKPFKVVYNAANYAVLEL